MEAQECFVLQQINKYYNQKLKKMLHQYSRFDAYNKKYIVEIKCRGKDYNETLIEFDKYTFNKEYAKITGKQFIYVVGLENKIYIFNISKLNNNGYDYRWEWKRMPKQTEFEDTQEIYKLVGYINIEMANKIILKDNS